MNLFYENVRWFEDKDEFVIGYYEGRLDKPYRGWQETIVFQKEMQIWKLDGHDKGSRMFFCGSYNTIEELEPALLFIVPLTLDGTGNTIREALGITSQTYNGPFIFD